MDSKGMKERLDKAGNKLRKGEYQRKDGRYEFRYYDENDQLISIYEDTLTQLRAKEYIIALKETTSILTDMKNVTINDQYDMWIASKGLLRPYTLEKYMQTYESFVRGGFGKLYINEINPVDIKAFYTKLIIDRRIKVETVGHVQNILYQVFAMAKESGGILTNPTEGVMKGFKRSHKKNSSTRKGLTVDQEQALFDKIYKHPIWGHWYMPIYVLAKTGLRKGEFQGLQWSDIDFETHSLSVNHELSYYRENGKYTYHYSRHLKTDASYRTLPITKEIEDALLMQAKYLKEKKINCNSVIDGESDFIFLNKDGKVFDIDGINRALKRIASDYNRDTKTDAKGRDIILPNLYCYIFRHTYAKRLVEADVNPKVAQMLLGHNDIRSTFDIYMDYDEDKAMEEYWNKVTEYDE